MERVAAGPQERTQARALSDVEWQQHAEYGGVDDPRLGARKEVLFAEVSPQQVTILQDGADRLAQEPGGVSADTAGAHPGDAARQRPEHAPDTAAHGAAAAAEVLGAAGDFLLQSHHEPIGHVPFELNLLARKGPLLQDRSQGLHNDEGVVDLAVTNVERRHLLVLSSRPVPSHGRKRHPVECQQQADLRTWRGHLGAVERDLHAL
mmetsp:Transcript_92844/g.277009  ORF Transcript_92844/g.277009 Transcript_92844/m.277009 type:complete len:206 (-) Transcript_92844:140-757(-)